MGRILIRPREYRLGNNLKHYRKLRHATQEEMAVLCSISTKTYSAIENGDRNPSGETMLMIAKALGVENKNSIWKMFYLQKVNDDGY